MIDSKINDCIQRILNSQISSVSDNVSLSRDALEKYKFNTAFRLSRYIYKYRMKRITLDDLLVALRNYLLLFKTTVVLPEDIDITGNKYGLRIDGNGYCYASMDIPKYLQENIISQGFMKDYVQPQSKEKYFLGVTPNIFKLTGFKYFKSIRQKLAVNGVLNMPEGYTALVALPTGGGKSLITQTIAYQKETGLTIAVVPTVSLAIDQVRVAKENIRISKDGEIACYYSDLGQIEKKRLFDEIKNKMLRLLFISPEALIKNELFKNIIEEANKSGYLNNIVIDEAHIVIEWGALFRVDYQCLEPWRNTLVQSNAKLKTVLLSATFEKSTVELLRSMFSVVDKWIEIRCDALRREPRFGLVKASSKYDKNKKIEDFLRILPRPMIIYVASPEQAEAICNLARNIGITNLETFTGKTKSAERARIIDDWSNNEIDLMIATSAFGVGVDKSDVRTVLHLYVPVNPNAYYQELGRGGRDGLPCLSVMCIEPKADIDAAFAMVDKVLVVKKILGRWESMLNSPTAQWFNGTYTLDTSVKPKYNAKDYIEVASKVDQQWNIYVILLLRRYELISVLDMIVDPSTQNYLIRIKINDTCLLHESVEAEKVVTEIRDREWKKNEREFKLMKTAIQKGNKECWSEMFFNGTYNKVSEFCAGCGNHGRVIEAGGNRFELVKKVSEPLRKNTADSIFYGKKEALLITSLDDYSVLSKTIGKGIQIVLFDEEFTDRYMNLLLTMETDSNVRNLGFKEYFDLVEHGDLYYTSGDAIALYEPDLKEKYQIFLRLRKASSAGKTRILHMFEDNIYFKECGKRVSEIVEGPYLENYLIERM
jgi:Superfamily II DNA helicase